MAGNKPFTFEISLSVLDHLGRHLYRSFATVLGEAISNSWDADAKSVRIYIDPKKNDLWIKDDGVGMTASDFQDRFLKIGYSKRKNGHTSKKGRPYIGRKGIGKLALLSCADRISIISKIRGDEYVGGTIDNTGLDQAISEDLKPQEYSLAKVNWQAFHDYKLGHKHGTIIRFEGMKDNVKRSSEFLSKIIALYFRFSLLDKSFKIYLNDKLITHRNLKDLAEKTQFLWKVGMCGDPYIQDLEKRSSKKENLLESKSIQMAGISGFVASVKRPRDLKILTTDQRVGVDLFVNGRLRERDILGHIPTARIVENYLYGQIHFNDLDDKIDRFTSSREGIVADDKKYQEFLNNFHTMLLTIVEDWDLWRVKHRESGDDENKRMSKSERASRGLYNAVTDEFKPPKKAKNADKVDRWVDDLSSDAAFNFESYAECFISENLVRKYIKDKKIALSKEAKKEVTKFKDRETRSKNDGNISIIIRKDGCDLSYLSMRDLANLVDKPKGDLKQAALARDAADFKPMRDAVAHTALLTDQAKKRLTAVRENIKARIKKLLGGK